MRKRERERRERPQMFKGGQLERKSSVGNITFKYDQKAWSYL